MSHAAAQATAPAVSLGSAAVGTSTTGTVTFTFSASTTVTAVSVVTQGAANADFTLNTAAPGTCGAATYSSNQTCTVAVKFTAGAAGLRRGAVTLATSAGVQAGGVAILSGTGTGGLLTAVPGTQVAITGTSGFTAAGPMAVDGAGNLYIADRSSGVVYKEAISGTTATQTQLFNVGAGVASIALDATGNIFLASPSAKEIYELQLTAPGTYTQLGLEPCNYACNAVALDPNGNLYYSDLYNVFVLTYNGNGSYNTVPQTVDGFVYAAGIATPGDGYLYVSSAGTENKVYKLQFNGVTGTSGATPTHSVSSPGSLVLDPAGNVYATSSTAGIQRFHFNNGNTAVLGNVVAGGVAIAGNGTVYLNDGASTIYAVNQAAAPSTTSSSQNYTAPEKSVTLMNIGNATATLGASTTAAPFAIASDNACTSGLQLASTSTCALNYTFSPTTGASPQTGTITVASDSGTATLNLTGNVSGVPAALTFTAAPATPVVAGGNPGTAKVQVTDSQGNVVTAPTAVTISSNYPGYPSVTANSSGGTATIPLTATPMTAAGSYTFTASTSGANNATATVVVTGAQAASLTVAAANTAPYPGIADSITVTGYDQYGNLSQTGDTIALTSTDAAATLPANFTLSTSTGAGSANVTFANPGNQTVTATDKTTGATGTSAAIAVKNLPVFIVTTLNNGSPTNASNCPDQANGGAPSSSNCGIYDATYASNAVGFTGVNGPQSTIYFSPSLYSSTQRQTCTVSSITPPGATTPVTTSAPCLYPLVLTITANVNIVGPGPDKFALQGFSPSSAAIFTLNASNVHFTLSGVTVTGSNGYSAIYNNKTGNSITLQNDVFYNNSTAGSSLLGGGAVYDSGTGNTLTIANSTFDSNSVINNGGVSFGGALYLSSVTYTITGSTFTNNTASYTGSSNSYYSEGGAIFATASPASTIRNSSFQGNTVLSSPSYAYGGAVYSTGGSGNDTYTGTVFIGNTAKGGANGAGYAGQGGALYYATKTLTLVDSLVQGNIATTGSSGNYGQAGGLYSTTGKYLYNTTVTGNYAKANYGGTYSLLYTFNSIVYGNGAGGSYPDATTLNSNVGSLASNASSATVLNPLLSAPSNIGPFAGPVNGAGAYAAAQYTMIPLPGSPALRIGSAATTGCTGYVNNASQTSCLAGQTTDARGLPRTQTNGVDAGQTESNYSLAFTAEPASTTVNTTVPGATNGTATATPFVQVYESGTPFSTGGTLQLTAAAGVPAPTSVTISASPQPISVKFPKPETNDSLTVSILNGAATPVTVVSTTSSTFNITDAAASLAFGTAPPAQLMTGSAPGTVTVKMITASGAVYTSGADTITLTVTASGYNTQTYTATAVNGVATFSSLPALTANGSSTYTYTYTASDTSSSPYTTDTVATTEAVVSTLVDHFTVTGLPSVSAPGTAYAVTVTAVDASGATVAGFTGPVTLSSTDAAATFAPLGYTFAAADAGVHTFTVTFNTRGTQTLVATNNTGQSGSVTVQVLLNYVWLVAQDGTLVKLNTSGTNALGGAVGTSGTTSTLGGVAFDAAGNVWSVTSGNNSLAFLTTAGTGAMTYTGGGLSSPDGVAVDGAGSVWVANAGNNSLSLFTNGGTAVSNSNGVAGASVKAPSSLAIDNTGGIWVTNKSANTVTHLFGAAQPVVTPLAGAVGSTQLGTKP